MQLIIHIGISKTGSTSLQSWLDSHRQTLQSYGYHYLTSVGTRNHTALPRLCFKKPRLNDEYFYRRGLRTAAKIQNHVTNKSQKLHDELETLPADVHTVITSSEHLYSRLNDLDEVAQLHSLLRPFFTAFQVVVYLRNQAELIESLYTTLLLETSSTLTLSEYARQCCGANVGFLDYSRRLGYWAAIFGAHNLIIRRYDSSFMKGGNVIADFAQTALPDISSVISTPNIRANRSVGETGQHILRYLNYLRSPNVQRDRYVRLHQRIKNALARRLCGKGAKLSPEDRAFVNERFATINATVDRQYYKR